MEKTVSSRVIYDGCIIRLRRDEALAENGAPCVREVVEHPGGAAVAALTEEGRLVCVRQYRYPCGQYLLEIPAGKLSPGEPPLLCAQRELEEETGFTARRWDRLGEVFSSPGFCDERLHLFLARELEPGEKHPDEDEFLTSELYFPAQLRALAAAGELSDAKTLAALCLLEGILEKEAER